MSRLPLLAVLALTGLPLAAQAAPRAIDLHARTAGDLAELCAANPQEASGDAKINYCHGFAQGVAGHRRCTTPGTTRCSACPTRRRTAPPRFKNS